MASRVASAGNERSTHKCDWPSYHPPVVAQVLPTKGFALSLLAGAPCNTDASSSLTDWRSRRLTFESQQGLQQRRGAAPIDDRLEHRLQDGVHPFGRHDPVL
jgi:hypothetical protein